MDYSLRKKTKEDNEKVSEIIKNWGSDIIVTRGKSHSAGSTEGILAIKNDTIVGICLYAIVESECEIVLLEVFKKGIGIGSELIREVNEIAKNNSCKRLWLVTTNDNIEAIKFYQKRGFVIANIHVNAIEESRKIKPEIPYIGNNNIPIRDEIEFEMKIQEGEL